MAIHSSILAWRIPMDRRAWWVALHGVAKSQTRLSNIEESKCWSVDKKNVAYKSIYTMTFQP